MTATIVFIYTLVAITCIGALGASFFFRQLVDIEFVNFHDQWESDGKPTGGKESRRHASFWKSDFANFSCFHSWLLVSPSWIEGHMEARRCLRRTRQYTLVMIVGIAGLNILLGYA